MSAVNSVAQSAANSVVNAEFGARLRRIEKTNRRLARGWKPRMDRSGLVTLVPTHRFRVPRISLFVVLVGFFVFKGYLLTALGTAAYDAKLALLGEGTVVERAGAWVMQPDPVSLRVGEALAALLG